MLSEQVEEKTYTPRELRVKLAEHNLKGTDFANMVGVTQAYISQILTGRARRPSRVVRIRIAEVVKELDKELEAELAAEKAAEEQHEKQEPRVRRL